MSSLSKLPPHVARELRRHVSPKPLPKTAQATPDPTMTATPRSWILGGCIGLVAVAGTFPLLVKWWITPLTDKEEALTASQIRRGAFNNSGSKDVGRDPNYWQVKNGTLEGNQYLKQSGYAAMVENEAPGEKKEPLPGEYLAMPAETMKKHQAQMEAFAKGANKKDLRKIKE